MLPRWLIGIHLFVLATAFVAAFVSAAIDWLWVYSVAYIAMGFLAIYMLMRRRWQNRNKVSAPVYWENKITLQLSYLGVKKARSWQVASTIGQLSLGLALVQHINFTIESDLVGILSSYNASDLLKIQRQ